ncbi:hypothetical protein AUR04nite_27650 [Glutamicibacter uratoxydans]|uniref:Lipoprotein n=1 Tax=Glutamicibacter uratoxydans TaxID=43667 RepID=A0A4Y4DRG9_GLUUR|nr:hypothetical protein [Glutamicibacter uratoxydans]GED07233.1 hypothetical protein AUR04nite_27650 [Glutamicibacter uratoxydans]
MDKSAQLPKSRHIYRSAGLTAAAAVIFGVSLSGCAALQDYSGDTCDGRRPVSTLEQAGKDLVSAVYANDKAGVCRVINTYAGDRLDDKMIAATKEILVHKGITPDNVRVVTGEQAGSHIPAQLTDGSDDRSHWIDVGATSVRGNGFTIDLPTEVFPPELVNQNDPSPSASFGDPES